MAERGDLTVLHEPFGNLKNYGETDAGGQVFDSAAALLAWLRGEARDRDVFLKDTMDNQYDDVLADRRFLAEARHAFLIRRPEEVAASYYALFPSMTINAIGMERRTGTYLHTVENSEQLARYAAHHRPFYERLLAQRLDIQAERNLRPGAARSPGGERGR